MFSSALQDYIIDNPDSTGAYACATIANVPPPRSPKKQQNKTNGM